MKDKTSRHLKVLQNAGLVEVVKRGRERLYRLDRERLQRVAGGWLAWFRQDPDRQAEGGV